jgi:uncharacterized membrane protein YgcG
MTTARAVARSLVLAMLATVMVVGAAVAQTLQDRITDEAGVLEGDGRDAAQAAIDALEDDAGVQLWALIVGTTGGESMDAFTERVADENALGGNDALLAIAVEDRRYQLWIGPALEDGISVEEHDRLLVDLVEPELVDEDWSGALAAAAQGLGEAWSGDLGPGEEPQQPADPDPAPAPGGSGADDAPSLLPILLGILLVGGGGWLLWSRWQGSRAA